MRRTEELWRKELGTTARHYRDAACFTETLMKEAGLERVERIIFPAEETKMYRRLIADGLVIRKTKLGYGDVKAIDAVPMYDLGMKALKADPRLMLCDSPECLFCKTY
jgi:hypothetical protein